MTKKAKGKVKNGIVVKRNTSLDSTNKSPKRTSLKDSIKEKANAKKVKNT